MAKRQGFKQLKRCFGVVMFGFCLAQAVCAQEARETTEDEAHRLQREQLEWRAQTEEARERLAAFRSGLAASLAASLAAGVTPPPKSYADVGAFLDDFTLEKGDIVVTAQGFHLFRGAAGSPSDDDFSLLADAQGRGAHWPQGLKVAP